ncbi:glycosyltransferase family 2 protein [Streptomyces sp. enrichment culture]|uniref:glycosyltransferase family 2 protein n=1 Tax=Streptomyces sp. enrichment culture TaxID=1795815 RepID=UPI003F562D65
MPVKVSVIVPVYNPGHYIDDCVDSLLRQSLPDDEYEVIFVDDGSTDDTPARLDAVAAEHPHVHVIHQENSGWSGKPRNVGIDASKGEFVMFVDNDDYLGLEALERMYDYGVAHDADVIVGKMAGKGRGVPVELFRRNHPRATVDNAPLIDSLTPHKMVRRAFLDRTGLRFPEGRRRLEDHVFVTEAYLRAGNVSVLSDYVCYYHVRRDDASNAGFQQFDPAGYFKNLREALDVVERYTEPGATRDRLYRRWLRNEMVERLRGTRFLKAPEDFRKELFQQIHEVVVERFGPGVAAGLTATQKFVARLAREGRYDDVAAFAEWEAGIRIRALPERVGWRAGALEVVFAAEYVHGGKPMTFPADAVAPSAEPPESVQEAIDWLAEDTVARFDKGTLDLVLKERSNAAPHFQPVTVTRDAVPAGEDRVRLVLRATATVDPATAAGDGPLGAGLWDAVARLKLGGWTKEVRVGPAPKSDRSLPPAGLVAGRVVLPYWTDPHRNFSLDVDKADKRLGLTKLATERITLTGERLSAPLPLYVPSATEVALRLTSPASATPVELPATLSPATPGTGSLLTAELPAERLADGIWRTALVTAPDLAAPRRYALSLELRARSGLVEVVRAPEPGLARRVVRKVRRMLGGASARAGR